MDGHTTQVKGKRGGRYCVAGGPGSTSCTNTSYTSGIKMHQFPKDEAVWMKGIGLHSKIQAKALPYALLILKIHATFTLKQVPLEYLREEM